MAPLALVAALLAAPGPAQATLLVRSDANGLFIKDKNNLFNILDVRGSSNGYRLESRPIGGEIFKFDRQAGCFAIQGSSDVFCQRITASIRYEGGATNDHVTLTGITVASNVVFFGGDGLDDVEGQPGPDELHGGPEPDHLRGAGGNDTILGDGGIDTLVGGTGADRINGGPDADKLHGETGNDRIEGGTGGDKIFGDSFDDTILGGDGGDTIDGGSGRDVISGGAGEDVITSKDPEGSTVQADFVDCGTGFDSVFADLKDILKPIGTCEEIERSPVGETPHVRLPRKTMNVSAAGAAIVRLRCPGRTRIGCKGTLSLRLAKRGARRPSRTRYAIRAGRSARVRVQLTDGETGRLRVRVRGILTSLERGRLGAKTTITRPRLH